MTDREDEMRAAETVELEALRAAYVNCNHENQRAVVDAQVALQRLRSPLPSLGDMAVAVRGMELTSHQLQRGGPFWVRWVASEAAHRDTGTIHGTFLRLLGAWADELEAR